MATVATGRSEWPVIINSECTPDQFVECFDDRWSRFRTPIVGFLLAILLVVGVLTALTERTWALQSDSLSFQQRADVMTGLDVGFNIFSGGDPSLIDHYVNDDATVAYPGGSASGPEAARHLSRLIAGGQDNRAFTLDFERMDGDSVILNWVLDGPIAPGSLIWYSVPEGSAIAGELEVEVVDGEVAELTLSVTS